MPPIIKDALALVQTNLRQNPAPPSPAPGGAWGSIGIRITVHFQSWTGWLMAPCRQTSRDDAGCKPQWKGRALLPKRGRRPA
ncbi:MAG TPA: hypothetical protein VN765_05980 [Candidatus Acidoferrum sp.]|nr:hypothetical protein [Candidatus Acidoferrum sp.]